MSPDEGLAWIGTHHATPSVETSELVIELATSLVLARLPPGSVQAAAAAWLGEPPGALLAGPGTAALETQLAALELPLLPQPPAARLATTSKVKPAIAARFTTYLIRLISYGCSVVAAHVPAGSRPACRACHVPTGTTPLPR